LRRQESGYGLLALANGNPFIRKLPSVAHMAGGFAHTTSNRSALPECGLRLPELKSDFLECGIGIRSSLSGTREGGIVFRESDFGFVSLPAGQTKGSCNPISRAHPSRSHTQHPHAASRRVPGSFPGFPFSGIVGLDRP
jgi:hypothetical protein